MRTLLILVVFIVLGGLFVAQKQREQKAAASAPTAAAAAMPRKVSEHNWAKHALDTTNRVKQQVAQQRKEDGTR